jgi:hypothetical protein
MKFAVIVHRPFGLENHGLFSVDRDQDVPGTIARSSRMGDEIGIDPLDRIAHMCGNLRRHKAELLHLHLNSGGARRTRHNDENERAERLAAYCTSHGAALFEYRRDVFGVLLVALKNLQAGRE